MTTDLPSHFDAIVVGSGAGGSAAAYKLVNAGLKVLLIEKGPVLPKSAGTLDIQRVVHQGEFKSREQWRDRLGRTIVPEEYFNVGGKTKWYGAALLRYSPSEFEADAQHRCPAWPIGYATLAPYYMAAEQRLRARAFEIEPDLRDIVTRLAKRSPEWCSEPLPLGLSADILGDRNEAMHFDGFASPTDMKGDADTAFLASLLGKPNFMMLTGTAVTELLGDPNDGRHIIGVRLQGGQRLFSRSVLLAAGALHSPRLLQRYMDAAQLQSLPAYDNVGRFLKLHLLTAMVAVSATRKTDLLRKTQLLLNHELPHSSVQPLGFDGELISTLIPNIVPRFVARQVGARAYGFFLQTEDSAHPDNRVYTAPDGTPVLDYDAARSPMALNEHRLLVRRFRGALNRIGMLAFSQRIDIVGTAHASGTMSAGVNPLTSVVDERGAVHGMRSLFVVDGGILPRSSRVNPSLSIFAWSLRVADLLALQLRTSASAPLAMARAS
jgi:choline dehydrogenase-like flavoprotein